MLSWIRNNRLISRILIVNLFLVFGIFTLYPLEVDAGRVRVRGYYRKDGTYVRPHYRTAPDGNPYNNYSFPGNYNPNTGRITPGNPQTYLNRYYNRSSSSYSTPSIDYDQWYKDWEADLDKQLKDLEADLDKQLKDFRRRYQTSSDVNVRGYFRKDGTYVRPHVRTAPDGDPTNNYSYPGNYNPNTGKITSGDSFQYLWGNRTHNSASSTSRSLTGGSFTVGSTMKEVIAVQGTPNSFTDSTFNYSFSTVYFENGRVTSWYSSPSDPLKAKLAATPTNKTYFSVGSTKGEVVAVQGTPNSFTDTAYNYGFSTVYFKNGRVTSWHSSPADPLKARLAAASTNKRYFTVGSTMKEVAAIQGTPNSFTDTAYNYGFSTVYFKNGRVTSWYSSPSDPLKARLAAASTNKRYFTVGSTMKEVAAIQGTPNSFTDTAYNYGFSTVYFKNGRVTSWYSSPSDPLKAKLAATPTNKTYFSVGSTKGEVVAVQGTPNSFTDTTYYYGFSTVYFKNGRVASWYSSPADPLKVKY